jgi:uncharacterized membrane protein YagU involved in acid resistance
MKTLPFAGLIIGTADICCACFNAYLRNGVTPDRVLRYVASGIFGKNAFSEGSSMLAWGLGFHYVIAFIWAFIFILIYPNLLKISTNHWLLGIGYGISVWLIMNLLIVPMSQVMTPKMTVYGVTSNMIILIIAIGLPLAFIAKRFLFEK